MSKSRHKTSDWSGEALDRAFGLGMPEYIFYLMLQATRRREAALNEALEPIGLTVPKFRALIVISRLKSTVTSEVAHLSSVDRTTLTRTLDQLVSAGLVHRTPSPTDRRVVRLSLSAAGEQLVEQARDASHNYNETMLMGVPDDRRMAALRLLQQVVDNMIDDDDIAHGVLTYRHTSPRAADV